MTFPCSVPSRCSRIEERSDIWSTLFHLQVAVNGPWHEPPGDDHGAIARGATVLVPFLRGKPGKLWQWKRASMLGKSPPPAKLPETHALKVSVLD